jgi:glucokinase
VYKGEILRGGKGSCCEIGHIPVVRDGPLCGCGRRGCLEAVAGRLAIAASAAMAAYRGDAPNLLRIAGTDVKEIRSQALAEAIAAGDGVVEAIVREAAQTIGWAMAGVVNVLAPDTVVVGGGLVEDMPALFRDEVERAIRARVMPSFEKSFRLAVATLAGDAVISGAAAWAEETVRAKN